MVVVVVCGLGVVVLVVARACLGCGRRGDDGVAWSGFCVAGWFVVLGRCGLVRWCLVLYVVVLVVVKYAVPCGLWAVVGGFLLVASSWCLVVVWSWVCWMWVVVWVLWPWSLLAWLGLLLVTVVRPGRVFA